MAQYRIFALDCDDEYCEIGTVRDDQCDDLTRDYLATHADTHSSIVILDRWSPGIPYPFPSTVIVNPPVPEQTLYIMLRQCAESYATALRIGARWLEEQIDDLVAIARQTGDRTVLDALRYHYAHIVERAEREYDNPPLPRLYWPDDLRDKAVYLIQRGDSIVRYNVQHGAYTREQLIREYDKLIAKTSGSNASASDGGY